MGRGRWLRNSGRETGTGKMVKELRVGDRDRDGDRGTVGGTQGRGRWSRNIGRETGTVVKEEQAGDRDGDGG